MSLGLDPCCSRGNPETQYNSSWTTGCHNYLDELAGLITAAMLCIPGNEKTNHGPTIKLQNAQVLVEWPKRLILTWCAPVPAQILETWVAKNPIDIFVRVVKSQSSMRLNGITVHESHVNQLAQTGGDVATKLRVLVEEHPTIDSCRGLVRWFLNYVVLGWGENQGRVQMLAPQIIVDI